MAFFSGSEPADGSNPILAQPNIWLPILANGLGGEYFFFTHDLKRTMIYLTESIWSVCGIRREDWVQKTFGDFLTQHPLNQCLARPDQELEAGKVYRTKIEVLNSALEPVGLELWRSLVLERDIPIGVVGMAARFREDFQKHVLGEVNLQKVRERMTLLNKNEIEVCALVVQGELNKSIAKKLGVSMRTIEARRSKAMEKLGIIRLTDLIRYWILTMEPPLTETEPG